MNIFWSEVNSLCVQFSLTPVNSALLDALFESTFEGVTNGCRGPTLSDWVRHIEFHQRWWFLQSRAIRGKIVMTQAEHLEHHCFVGTSQDPLSLRYYWFSHKINGRKTTDRFQSRVSHDDCRVVFEHFLESHFSHNTLFMVFNFTFSCAKLTHLKFRRQEGLQNISFLSGWVL